MDIIFDYFRLLIFFLCEKSKNFNQLNAYLINTDFLD